MGKAGLPELQQRVGDVPSLDTTAEVKTRSHHLSFAEVKKPSGRERWSMRPIKLRTETLTILHVTHDRTTGSPKGRESYGDGDPIVVDGVTTIQGGWR